MNNNYCQVDNNAIAKFMGNFDQETNILKKFARKGQCFSTTKYICTLKPEQVEMKVADVKRDGFCFSDGVGYIS